MKAKRITDEELEKRMPESEHPGIKQIMVQDCKECHSLRWTAAARRSRSEWTQVLERMSNDLLGRRQPLWFSLKDDEFAGGKRKEYIIDYLAKNFGQDVPRDPTILGQGFEAAQTPPHPSRNLPSALLSGAAANYSAFEYSLPTGSSPEDMAIDSQGPVWISESNTGMIGRFDPSSFRYDRIAPPSGKDPKARLGAIVADPQDHIWIADDGPNARILQYDPKRKEYKEYRIPDYSWEVSLEGPSKIETLFFSGGILWATRTTANHILKLDPATGKITEFSIPRGSAPFGLTRGGDNMIWYSAEVGNVVVRMDPSSGKLTPFEVLTLKSDLRGLASDAEGNLWVAAAETGNLVKIDFKTGKPTQFPAPTEESGPFAVAVDRKTNRVWFSEALADRIVQFDPLKQGTIEFPVASADADIRRIQIDPAHSGRVWWLGRRSGKLGYLDVP